MKIRLSILLLVFAGALSVKSPKRQGYGPGEQDWGWIDVRSGAHMFYWLFYTQASNVQDFTERPLVIWLQGGPGASSTGYGNFAELGPLYVNGTSRPSSWANYVNLLFIDNPVGSGFSYVDSASNFVTNNNQIGADMVQFLKVFYSNHPDFGKVPLYIFCESYGGKMVVEIAKQLNKAIETEELNINFKGVALGDSWISPIDSVKTWGPFLLHTGVVDQEGHDNIAKGAEDIQAAIDANRWTEATNLWGQLEGTVMQFSAGVDFYNILYEIPYTLRKHKSDEKPSDLLYRVHVARDIDSDIQDLMEGPVKEALGLDPKVVHGRQSGQVFNALYTDFMKPVTDIVEELLNSTNLEVTVFSGQLDLIVDTIGTVRWVDRLKWSGAKDWKRADRSPLVVNNIIQGYHKNVGKLHFYWVDRAGHMVPTDNPDTAIEILSRVTNL